MRIAAFIYAVTAVVALGFDVYAAISIGRVGVGSVFMAIVAGALMVTSYQLYRRNERCRRATIFSSLFVAFALAIPAALHLLEGAHWSDLLGPGKFFVAILGIAVAHAIAVAFLLKAKPSAP